MLEWLFCFVEKRWIEMQSIVWYEIIYLSPEVQRAYAAYWKWNAPRIDYQKFTIQWVWRVYKTFRKDLKKIFFLDIDGVEN